MNSERRFWVLGFFLLIWAQPVMAQWQNGNLALRTNGNTFQSGDQVRVELIALEPITESFSAEVVYVYTEMVEDKSEDDKVTMKQVERTRKREGGPQLENFGKYQMLLLDDRFHFGDASPGGWYEVRVNLFQAYTRKPISTLRTCLFHQNSSSQDQSNAGCELFLRTLKRVNNEMFWTFDGRFKTNARYSVLFLQGGKVLKHLVAGAYSNGPREFNMAGPELEGTAGQTYDLLIHDHASGYSTTLAKVTIPEAQ
jgi:hypothetical protein